MVQVKLFQGVSFKIIETEINKFMNKNDITKEKLIDVKIHRFMEDDKYLQTMVMLFYDLKK